MKTTFIYTLSDNDGNVRYIGKSNTPRKRLYAHIKECKTNNISHKINWVKSLLNKGETPLIEVLEEVLYEDWESSETYWIEQFRQWGFELTNISVGGYNNNYKRTTKTKERMRKSKLGTKLSESQKRKISDSVKQSYIDNPDLRKVEKTIIIDRDLLYQKYIVENLSMPKCSKFFNTSETTIYRNLKDYFITKDKVLWTKQCANNKVAEDRIVFQYGLDGKLIKKWNSHLEAANELNIDYKSIMSVCSKREGFKSYKRFIWRYNLEEINILELYKRRV